MWLVVDTTVIWLHVTLLSSRCGMHFEIIAVMWHDLCLFCRWAWHYRGCGYDALGLVYFLAFVVPGSVLGTRTPWVAAASEMFMTSLSPLPGPYVLGYMTWGLSFVVFIFLWISGWFRSWVPYFPFCFPFAVSYRCICRFEDHSEALISCRVKQLRWCEVKFKD